MSLIDIRAHGGVFGGGKRIKTNDAIIKMAKYQAVSFHYGGNRAAYNDEADGLILIAYINGVGGDFRVKCYDRDLNLKFETYNLGSSIYSVARDDTHFYVSRAGLLSKYPIVSSGNPSPVWNYTIPNGANYDAMKVRNGKVYGLNNNTLKIDVINSSGQLEDTIPISAWANLMEMDKNGFIYIYDINDELYKLDTVSKQKLWSVPALQYNGSNPNYLRQSENYIFVITSNNYAARINKQTGAIATPLTYIDMNNRISFDQFGNSFVWRSGDPNVNFKGKESFDGGGFTQSGFYLENVYGVKKPFSVGASILVLDFYYALNI